MPYRRVYCHMCTGSMDPIAIQVVIVMFGDHVVTSGHAVAVEAGSASLVSHCRAGTAGVRRLVRAKPMAVTGLSM